jgi:RNA polymerase sigma factor (sigma-70 family)
MAGMKTQRAIGQIRGLLERGALGHLSDTQLLDLFFLGQCDADAAFETLLLRHGPSVLRTCRRILGDRGETDDAFQATFLVLARRARSLHPQASIGPWLAGVARRIAMKARRAAIRRRLHERQCAVSAFVEAESHLPFPEALREEIDRLPDHLRAPIVLCYLERMSYKSAAETLAITEGAIRGRLAKARDILKLRLSRDPEATCAGRRDAPLGSFAPTVPLALLESTNRAAKAFSRGCVDESRIASSILKMAEGALKMMFVTRITRVFVVLLLGAAGAAFVGLKTNGGELAERMAGVARESKEARGVAVAERETPRDILIQAESIRTRAENDQVLVDGPGTLSLWVDHSFLTNRIQDLAKGPHTEPALLKISWSKGMQLTGRTTAAGRPCARAEFRGKIIAQIDDSSIRCEDLMMIQTLQPIPFEKIQIVLKGPASDGLARHPETKIARVDAYRKVVVVGDVFDPERQALAPRQRIECDDSLIFDSRTGEYRVSGKGKFILDEPNPVAQPPAKDEAFPPGMIEISFITGMSARPSSASKTTTGKWVAEFHGKVTFFSFISGDTKTEAATDRNGKQHDFLTANEVRLVVESEPRNANSRHPYRLLVQPQISMDGAGALFEYPVGRSATTGKKVER